MKKKSYSIDDLNLKYMKKVDKDGNYQDHFVCNKCGYVLSNEIWFINSSIIGAQLYFLEECFCCGDKKNVEILLEKATDKNKSDVEESGWNHIRLKFISRKKWYKPTSWNKGSWVMKSID